MKTWTRMESPIGGLVLVEQDGALLEIGFADGPRPASPPADAKELPDRFAAVVGQLEEYFRGERRMFDLALAPRGTPFQQNVWQALCDIPFGESTSYGEIARRIGNPKAVRAVGLANGRNPLPIVIPCHRVIGANGTLTGYGGGLPIKRRLLALEGVAFRETASLF